MLSEAGRKGWEERGQSGEGEAAPENGHSCSLCLLLLLLLILVLVVVLLLLLLLLLLFSSSFPLPHSLPIAYLPLAHASSPTL
eukprot:9322266-Pyramimonas_sp.AAC.1